MASGRTILVSGGRSYSDRGRVWQVLDQLHTQSPITTIVTGGANGADALAKRWAMERDVDYVNCPAKWGKHGPAAGPIRNAHMLDNLGPFDLVVTFPGGKGTADLRQKAVMRGLDVMEIV
jgi:hypothetical protein